MSTNAQPAPKTKLTKNFTLARDVVTMLAKLRLEEDRSASNMIEVLVRQEFARRESKP